jgi:hypothetical protein
MEIRSCSLCRHKLSSNFQRKPNFSLLSMIEKMARREHVQMASQNTQTEPDIIQRDPIAARQRQQKASLMEGKTMTVAIKRTGIELQFK